jgi:hypothetical protein
VKYDLAVLEAADAIVIHWRNLGHSLFYRTVYYADKLNKRVIYLGNSNEKHLLQTPYRNVFTAPRNRVMEIYWLSSLDRNIANNKQSKV